MQEIKDSKKGKESGVFTQMEHSDHEQVVYCYDKPTNLKAIICIHNTNLGPALGGTRMWNYASEEEALVDVLRLARGMTYKAAISDLNLGGGKAVIIGDPQKIKTDALLRKFGQFVESLKGRYITAEDVNMSPEDMEQISRETRHVTGLSESVGGGGDPSPVTAYGVYMGMKAAAKKVYGTDSLQGKKVMVQGVGHVGMYLLNLLHREGAVLYVSDISAGRVGEAVKKYNAVSVDLNNVYKQDVDIYAPCALGATINDATIDILKCRIIAGAANNQLKDEIIHGRKLKDKNIIYAPDFLINAGGLINVGIDYLGGWSKEMILDKTENIYQTTLEILNMADKEGISTHEAALQIAENRIFGNINIIQ